MKKELRLSLVILALVVFSVLFLGLMGVSCEIWTHAALSSAKKVGSKVVLRAIKHSELVNLPIDRFPLLDRFIKPGI